MAAYKHPQYLRPSTDQAFDLVYTPGTPAPHSGIYRCDGCGREHASNVGNPLPPQNHHQHTLLTGPIRWRLIVFAQAAA